MYHRRRCFVSVYHGGIRVIKFWCLKPGFGCILSFNARNWAWKMRFYKPFTMAASESEFDHENRILCLKSRRASLYSGKIIKMSWLANGRLLILWSLHGSLRCCETDRETDCTTSLSLDTQDIQRGQLQCARDPCVLTTPIHSRERVWNFLSVSDRNHANRPNIIDMKSIFGFNNKITSQMS